MFFGVSLFVLLFDALPVAAESTSPYSMNDSYWHDFALAVAQGFPMGALTLIVGMFFINSLKLDVDEKAQIMYVMLLFLLLFLSYSP
jgi:hypothetical protein